MATNVETMTALPAVVRVPAYRVFLALLWRDIHVAQRELPVFLLRTILQPLMFVIVFGGLLPRMGFIQRGYTSALLPGVLAVSLTFASIQSVALPMVVDFGWTREIEDRLLAPIPISLVAFEKIISGVLQGIIAAVIVLPIARFIMGPIDGLTFSHIWEVIGVTIAGATAFSALGLVLGTAFSPQNVGLMFSMIVAPMIFFGCAYYPWSGLHVVPIMQYIVLINPLVYVAEGLRGALTPSLPHMPLALVLTGLIVHSTIFWMIGSRTFNKLSVN
jgi:ABC-2 type transport system permease protein